jgi:hypothetical protein
MPRARTGTLVKPGRDGFHRGRFTKDEPDGTTARCAAALESPSGVGERSEISSSNRETATARRPLPAVADFAPPTTD